MSTIHFPIRLLLQKYVHQTLQNHNRIDDQFQATPMHADTPVPSVQQTPPYQPAAPQMAAQQTNRIDFSQLERQQAELEQREKRLAERERELRNLQVPRKSFNLKNSHSILVLF